MTHENHHDMREYRDGRKFRWLWYDASMNRIATEGMNMEQVDVRDLPEEQAQMVQAFVDFLRQQMGKHVKQEKQAVAPFSVWSLGAKGHLSRADIYERI